MHFPHQISITSQTGVGSTSLLKELQARLVGQSYRFVSAGGLFRTRARELGMTVDEFTKHCRSHPEEEHDHAIDQAIAKMAATDWMVCESRLSHFFMPGAFKVLMVCRLRVRATRRWLDEYPTRPFEVVLREMSDRDSNDRIRYEALYSGCMWLPSAFDLVVDTEHASTEQIADLLLERHENWWPRLPELPGVTTLVSSVSRL